MPTLLKIAVPNQSLLKKLERVLAEYQLHYEASVFKTKQKQVASAKTEAQEHNEYLSIVRESPSYGRTLREQNEYEGVYTESDIAPLKD